jgi:hypothetical protein
MIWKDPQTMGVFLLYSLFQELQHEPRLHLSPQFFDFRPHDDTLHYMEYSHNSPFYFFKNNTTPTITPASPTDTPPIIPTFNQNILRSILRNEVFKSLDTSPKSVSNF